MLDIGRGAAVAVIPGIQGRWEWMGPAVDALASRCRVVTGSLAGDHGSLAVIEPGRGFDSYIDWVDELLRRAGLQQAALCGVSYGGLVALRYAATRPERVTALVLVSTPSPAWKPNFRVDWYLKAPRLLFPVFALSSPLRLYPEIAIAFPSVVRRGLFALRYLHRVARYPFAPTRMAQRVRLLEGVDFASDCLRVKAPTLVVTGDPELDHVVPVESTREYLTSIDGAIHKTIEGTGHIGLVTKPDRFADIVSEFVTGRTEPSTRATSQVPA